MNEEPSVFDRLLGRAIHVLPFACLTTGAWLLSPSAGLMVLGALVWLDLQVHSAARRKGR